ncbi:MAG: 50S ribosomal protein L22 [Eubacteriales bacterium]|nr:50S ribosomal protein L22 [Eubacteriales bacterium]
MATRSKTKAANRAANKSNRPTASARFIRISPRKVRIVIDLIRGKNVNEAEAILASTPKAASEVVGKLLKSAIANAVYKEMDRNNLYVAEIYANEGPTLKRMMPRAKGQSARILKRMSHIHIALDEINK